jgi:hypothetical protein
MLKKGWDMMENGIPPFPGKISPGKKREGKFAGKAPVVQGFPGAGKTAGKGDFKRGKPETGGSGGFFQISR